MNEIRYETDDTCDECGRFGAYAFDGERLCLDCYEGRGSCCAERTMDVPPDQGNGCDAAVEIPRRTRTSGEQEFDAGESHRVSANCCYQACPGCSYLRKLRDFQSRFPHDWRTRLRGLPRIVAAARERE